MERTEETSLFDMIKEENKWDTLFGIPAPRKNVKISPSTLKKVFEEFKFRTINDSTSKNVIYKTIVNTAFAFNIIMSKSENGNVTYFINDEIKNTLFALENMCKAATAINSDDHRQLIWIADESAIIPFEECGIRSFLEKH